MSEAESRKQATTNVKEKMGAGEHASEQQSTAVTGCDAVINGRSRKTEHGFN